MNAKSFSRRAFLHRGIAFAAGAPLALRYAASGLPAEALGVKLGPSLRPDAKVAIVPCRSYGPEVRESMAKCFDLLGGIGSLVKNKTVTVKLNLTGTDFSTYMGRPVGETYM